MDTHFKFLSGRQRNFLLEVASKSGLSTRQLAGVVGISERNYRDWLREKFSISAFAAKEFATMFSVAMPEDEDALVRRWVEAKSKAGKKGGYACFRKHGSPATSYGRIKGGLRALEIARQKGLIPDKKVFRFPTRLTEEVAEFVGIMLGDGSLGKWQFEITLNRFSDAQYVVFVSKLIKNLFGEEPRVYQCKDSLADKVCVHGVSMIDYLIGIGLRQGNKVKMQIGVPAWITRKKKYSIACVRGLVDTDGCLFVHRYRVNGKQYAYCKLGFSNQSLPLIGFVESVLKGLGMHPKVTEYGGNHKLWLYRENEAKRYLDVVGSNNPRLLVFSSRFAVPSLV